MLEATPVCDLCLQNSSESLTNYSGHGMPNGTLCGKAVVEMMLAPMQGTAIEDVQEELVQSGNLPRSYVISRARILLCKELDSVEVQDRNGEFGVRFKTPLLSASL